MARWVCQTARIALIALVLSCALTSTATAAGPATVPGKYGCTESVYDASEGTFNFVPRGFIKLFADGSYRQNVGTTGTLKFRKGKTKFVGGDLAGSTAKAIDGDAKRFRIKVKLTGSTATWTCSRGGTA